MGLSACCQIFEDIVDLGKKERERAIQEQKQKEEEEEKKKLAEIEEKKKIFFDEGERKDIKILDNIENLLPKYTDKYKPLPAKKMINYLLKKNLLWKVLIEIL